MTRESNDDTSDQLVLRREDGSDVSTNDCHQAEPGKDGAKDGFEVNFYHVTIVPQSQAISQLIANIVNDQLLSLQV